MGEMDGTTRSNGFDDGYGNTGPDKDVEAGKFAVVPATLQVRTG